MSLTLPRVPGASLTVGANAVRRENSTSRYGLAPHGLGSCRERRQPPAEMKAVWVPGFSLAPTQFQSGREPEAAGGAR